MAKQESIVIKKVKKGGHGGAHGGAWKVAYADFVTAMMAFFLVMWLMGSDEEIKAEIEHYFNHPNSPYNAGRDPASDVARPRGENDGSGDSILRGTNGIFEEQVAQTSDRAWEVENGNWRIKIEESLSDLGIYALQSGANNVRFSISEENIFEPNSATFKPTAGKSLDRIATLIKKYPGQFVVTSHTADRKIASEEFQTNWDLSSARSTMILRFLVERHAFNPKKISAMGYADQHPLVENINEKARRANSRIDFVLTRRNPAQ